MNAGPGDSSLGTRAHDAAGVRAAARALLATPIVTVHRAPETLALVRRHVVALRAVFATQLGYRLIVESSFARLVKLPPEPHSPARLLTRAGGTPLGARTYALVALATAALLAPGTGEQILISALVAQIRSDAADQGITFTDGIAERRQLVAALTVLIDWGVLAETDGSVAQWSDQGTGEALLTVCRPLLPHLLVRSIGPDTADTTILAPEEELPRRRLRRRLAEDPVVLRRELSPGELDVLSRERSDLARHLGDNFGLTLEVRAEGALAYDPADPLSDIEFPGTGSAKQAALLLLGEIIDRVDGGGEVEFSRSGVEAILADLVRRHRKAWKAEYAESTARLYEDVTVLLFAVRLAEPVAEGIRLSPAAFRYRPRPVAGGNQLSLDSVDPQGDPS